MQLSLAMGRRSFGKLPLPPGKGAPRALWSVCVASMLGRTESRAPFAPQVSWLLEVSSVSEPFSVSLNEQRKLTCGESFGGKSLHWEKQPLVGKSGVAVNLQGSLRKETMCGAKLTTFEEAYLDSGRKFVVTSVMQGALRI